MRIRSASPSLFASSSFLLFLAACSNGAAPPSLDAGGSGSGSGSSSSSSSGPATDSGPNCSPGPSDAGPFTYSPQGCCYSVTPPALLQYTATALDNNSSVGADASAAAPERVRLGLGGNTTEGQAGYADPTTTAAFTWETSAPNTAAKVQFGLSATALSTTQTGYVWTLASTPYSAAVYMHEVHVCGLQPGTTYYYKVGGGAPGAEVWSAVQSFTTLPASGSITVGVYGDARDTVSVWTLANQRLKALNVDALVFSGDIVLSGGIETEYTTWLDGIWQDPSNPGQFLTLGQTLFLPVAGNHEYSFDTDAVHFLSAFSMPESGPYGKTFGSYNIGNAHFVFVDDQPISSITPGSTSPEATAQLAWLDADLAAANADRTNHPFIFVYSHRGMFSTSNHASDADVLQTRTTLSPIYAKYKVDGVFNGHDHEYERTFPLIPGADPVMDPPTLPTTGGTTYVICAGVGADPYAVGTEPVSWRAAKVPFGTAATGAQANYLGVYQTLALSGSTAVLTVYALTMAGPDPVVDTFTFKH